MEHSLGAVSPLFHNILLPVARFSCLNRDQSFISRLVFFFVGWGVGGGGGAGRGGNLGVILVWVCEPVFQNLPHSYTWPSKETDPFIYLIIQNVDLFIYNPLIFCTHFFAGYYTNIIVNSCNTKRISSLEKSLSEKYVHIPGCQKNGAFHIGIQKNRAIHILFVEKRGGGGQSYTWQR